MNVITTSTTTSNNNGCMDKFEGNDDIQFSRLQRELVQVVNDIPLRELETLLAIVSTAVNERRKLVQPPPPQQQQQRRRRWMVVSSIDNGGIRKRQKTIDVRTTVVVSAAGQGVGTTSTTTVTATCTCLSSIPQPASSVQNDDDHDNYNLLQPEVLRLIAHTGFLRSQDLGKLFLLTRKSFLQNLTPNFVYQILYETRLADRWASPTLLRGIKRNKLQEQQQQKTKEAESWIPRTLVRVRGYESVLRAMESLPVVKRHIVALPRIDPEASLNSNNTIFIVTFWVLSQQIYSRRLERDEVDQLTKVGHCRIPVHKSIFYITKLGLADNGNNPLATKLNRIRHPQSRTTNNVTSKATWGAGDVTSTEKPPVTAKIHCIRLDTYQTCTLYHSNLPRYEMQRTHVRGPSTTTSPARNNNNTTNDITSVQFPIQRALQNTPRGDQLIARWYQGWLEGIQNFGGLSFSMTLYQEGHCAIESTVFGSNGQQHEPLGTRNGVSPFHILEGLAGWQ